MPDSDDDPPVVDIRLWLQRPDWMKHAACAGLSAGDDLFFPERGENVQQAKAICRSCAVRSDCLDYAMINGEKYGIWGGISERERRRLRRLVRPEPFQDAG